MAEMKQRSLEEVKALSVEEAVEIMRQAGIVGAGGGGFPTYFKYKVPQPHLLVNATESEPGYWGDKLVHKEHLEEFLQLFEAMKAIFDFEQISLCVHEKDREWFSDYAEHAGDGFFDVRYVPDTYALGEEKTLVKHATEARVPRFLDTPQGMRRPGMPPDVGKVVNNSETLLNVYNALFLGKPTTTTVFTVYGEGIDLKVYEVPIGASFAEVLEIAGLDVQNSGHLSLLDGGPYLHDMGIKEIGNGDGYVRRMTNALFLIPKDREGKEYADTKTDPPEEGIVSLVGKVSGVHSPWRRFVEAGHPARRRGRRSRLRAETRRARGRGVLDRGLGEYGRQDLLDTEQHRRHCRRRDTPGGGRSRGPGERRRRRATSRGSRTFQEAEAETRR